MPFDPIKDEKKPMPMQEWADELKAAIDDYVNGRPSEWMKQDHTWHEWMGSFNRYMSW